MFTAAAGVNCPHHHGASRLALGTSATSRTYSAADNGEELKNVAFRDLDADRSLDLVVFGHSHVATLQAAPGGGIYGNAGTWLGDSTYLRIDQERAQLRRWGDRARDLALSVPRPRKRT